MGKYKKMKFDVGYDNEELNCDLQGKLFSEGYQWITGAQTFYNYGPYIYADAQGYISWGGNRNNFKNNHNYETVDPLSYINGNASHEELIEIL